MFLSVSSGVCFRLQSVFVCTRGYVSGGVPGGGSPPGLSVLPIFLPEPIWGTNPAPRIFGSGHTMVDVFDMVRVLFGQPLARTL